MKKLLLGLSIIFLLLFVGYLFGWNAGIKNSQQPVSAPRNFDPKILWALIQSWRLDNGLPPYTKDQKLCDLAQTRVKEIKNNFSHYGFDTKIPTFCAKIHCRDAAENLSQKAISEQWALQGWLESASHAAALRKDFKYSCIATDGDSAVQIFANY